MTLTIHQASVPVFAQGLKGLKGVLAKAAAHVDAKKLDPDALLKARLYPDMFPLLRQAQIATDFAKGCAARLAGEEVPAWDDTETSFEELIARVDRAIAYVESLDAARFAGAEDRDITLVRRGETSVVKGLAYLQGQAQPNFFFHLTTAYAILRKNGVEIGKKDYLGTT
ncbi:hypothetical protein PMI01_04751 [Caulobacter sp. AP07]|uniref:DUF1993 domain-containing protein n=1 Tax=Caulobacter sp. AP07 TaxID=1144304 RepID=UPI000271E445|nr:DUF1993 family protein [Caulobacter sp. AP07]EJL23747.1 hypothetical protein PMI01_04751 [Caulobacter sp. AP07]